MQVSHSSARGPYVVRQSPLLLSSWPLLELKLTIFLLFGIMWGSQRKTLRGKCSFHMLSTCIYFTFDRGAQSWVQRCFPIGPHSPCHRPWPLTLPGWVGEAETSIICENRVFKSACCGTDRVPFWVFFSFLTLRGSNEKFTWRSRALAIGRVREVPAGWGCPAVSWAGLHSVCFLSLAPLSPRPPPPSSSQLLLEMFFPPLKVVTDSVLKPSCRQALRNKLLGVCFLTIGKSLGIFLEVLVSQVATLQEHLPLLRALVWEQP